LRPRILITPDFDDADPPRYLLKRAYADAVLAAGGLPLIAAFDSPVDELLDAAQGLVVSGGAFDIPPEAYGAARHPRCGPTNESRTRFEEALLGGALERRLPILGVCGGMQLLNVLRGGSLVQDIASELPEAMLHEQRTPKSEPSHPIAVEGQSLLARAIDAGGRVNSTHHQAIGELGQGLVASALAPDGVIEAIEDPSFPFVLGVQWHPELLLEREPWNLGIYRLLVEAARR